MIECDGAVWVLDRDQRFIKTALGDRLRGARLTHQCQIIHRIAINALQRGNRVSADTLLRLWVHGAQRGSPSRSGGRRGLHLAVVAHHLRATCDHQVFHA